LALEVASRWLLVLGEGDRRIEKVKERSKHQPQLLFIMEDPAKQRQEVLDLKF
jgi:hypothetical protein